MQFGAFGDPHGHFDALHRIMARHPDVGLWLCPGDLGSEAGDYPSPAAPLYWIKGNVENFDFIAAQLQGAATIANLHYVPNGVEVNAAGLKLAGLGGTFAPTWYETPAAELPVVRGTGDRTDDKRRHFVHEEVAACTRLRGIDVFLSHEAARPYLLEPRPGVRSARRIDAGKTAINEILAAMQPRLHLFGHHHQFTVAQRQQVTSIGLEEVTESYLLVESRTLAYERLRT